MQVTAVGNKVLTVVHLICTQGREHMQEVKREMGEAGLMAHCRPRSVAGGASGRRAG